jgi:pseudouridine kinase
LNTDLCAGAFRRLQHPAAAGGKTKSEFGFGGNGLARVFCIGGAHLDRTARCIAGFRPGASNPVSVTAAPGGAALNTAFNLRRLGSETELISAIGRDSAGQSIVRAMDALGMDSAGMIYPAGRTTASYTAILEPGGDLVAGLADMDIYSDLISADIEAALDRLAEAPKPGDWAFLDANLPETLLAGLSVRLRDRGLTLAAAGISPAKIGHFSRILESLHYLFCNRAEIAALTGAESATDDDASVSAAAGALSREQQLTLFVTGGAEGVSVFARGTASDFPAAAARVSDVNGAGDAFAGGALHALMAGMPLPQAVSFGHAAAGLTVEAAGATRPDLSYDRVVARLGGA